MIDFNKVVLYAIFSAKEFHFEGGNMKKWHMEGIVSNGRVGHKLQVPHPGQRTLWSAGKQSRNVSEFFLTKMVRVVKERVQRSR